MINSIKNYYIENRLSQVDNDFLNYEEDTCSSQDLQIIYNLLCNESKLQSKLDNPYNSILLYITGISDEFDFDKARSDTYGGSPPDIDIDFDATEREKAIDWVVEKWGRDNVANIITHGTFKPKSLARSFYRVTEGDTTELSKILKMIPPPKYGREATFSEILELHPEIKDYEEFYNAVSKLENMVSNFGIHAAGVVISDFPIHDEVPLWKNSKAERITQYDKDEVESLGLIKFDFLSIDTLSILKEAVSLIKQTTGEDLDLFSVEDGDNNAYKILNNGLLTGIFQMETSGTARKLIEKIVPNSIEDLSDISALNRPGPIQAGLHTKYIRNKNNGYSEDTIPPIIEDVLKPTHYTLVYQEQVMEICCKMAGFSLKESDDIRRAMGKKKKDVLDKYRALFIQGSRKNKVPESFAESLWDDLVGFADYCLAGDTMVYTLEEGFVSIQYLVDNTVPATVVSMTDNGDLYLQQIEQWHSNGVKCISEYTLENNIKISCTSDHKFLTQKGMIPISEIYEKELSLVKGSLSVSKNIHIESI